MCNILKSEVNATVLGNWHCLCLIEVFLGYDKMITHTSHSLRRKIALCFFIKEN